jgi:hypothetical protein
VLSSIMGPMWGAGHGTYRRSNLVPVSHPLFAYGLERLKVAQVWDLECVAENQAM